MLYLNETMLALYHTLASHAVIHTVPDVSAVSNKDNYLRKSLTTFSFNHRCHFMFFLTANIGKEVKLDNSEAHFKQLGL